MKREKKKDGKEERMKESEREKLRRGDGRSGILRGARLFKFANDRYKLYSVSLGLLLKGDRDATGLCGCLEQSWLRIQRTRRDLVGDTPFRKSSCFGSQLFRCIHQPWKRIEGS